MENLITITTNEKQQQVVDARELHKFLGSKQEFAHWIKAKVVNNPFFTEGEDYVLLDNSNKQTEGRGGSNRIDYALTLDTAKKVSMAEQTDKGNEVRDYFIECEKIAKQPKVLDFNDPDVVLQLAQNWKDEKIAKEQALKLVEQKEKQLETQKPLVLFAEAVNNSNDLILIGDFAKSLGIKNFGRNKMFDKLKELKILMKNRMPYQQYIDSGVFVVSYSSPSAIKSHRTSSSSPTPSSPPLRICNPIFNPYIMQTMSWRIHFINTNTERV